MKPEKIKIKWTCEKCGTIFTSSRYIGSPETEVKCPICEEVFDVIYEIKITPLKRN
jgi:rubrerythrin